MSIIICGGQKRAGSLAMFQAMREIVEIKAAGRGDFRGREINVQAKNWVNDERIMVLKYHRYRAALDPYVDLVKVVMTIRDPRDVIVSLMHKYGYTFNRAIDSYEFKGNTFSYYRWKEKMPEDNLLVIKYEDFWEERRSTIVKVSRFMDFSIDGSEAFRIDVKWNIQANMIRARTERSPTHPEHVAKRHIYSGVPEQWTYILSDIQAQEVSYVTGDWMKEVGYE